MDAQLWLPPCRCAKGASLPAAPRRRMSSRRYRARQTPDLGQQKRRGFRHQYRAVSFPAEAQVDAILEALRTRNIRLAQENKVMPR